MRDEYDFSAAVKNPYTAGKRHSKPAPTRQRFRTAIAASLPAVFDVLLLVGGAVSVLTLAWQLLIRLPWALLTRDPAWRSFRLTRCWIYLSAAALAFGVTRIDQDVSRERANEVVQALKRFHAEQQRYPDKLDELVPKYLPRVPVAHPFAVSQERFIYRSYPKTEERSASDPFFGYTIVTPFGWSSYDFETGEWRFRD